MDHGELTVPPSPLFGNKEVRLAEGFFLAPSQEALTWASSCPGPFSLASSPPLVSWGLEQGNKGREHWRESVSAVWVLRLASSLVSPSS